MTIIIALATQNAALLVTDGRLSLPDRVVSDESEKIERINESLCVAKFGVENAECGPGAITYFKAHGALPSDPESIQSLITASAVSANKDLKRVLDPAVWTDMRLKVGLIGIGIFQGRTFLTGCLDGTSMPEPDSVLHYGSNGLIAPILVLGGEVCDATYHFRSLIESLLQDQAVSPDLMHLLLDEAVKTVRYAERHDDSIGGTIQYKIIQSGIPIEAGFRPRN